MSTYEAVVKIVVFDDKSNSEWLQCPAEKWVLVICSQSRVSSHLNVDGVAECQP